MNEYIRPRRSFTKTESTLYAGNKIQAEVAINISYLPGEMYVDMLKYVSPYFYVKEIFIMIRLIRDALYKLLILSLKIFEKSKI